jgi:citrate/tricarballylate utilization protein
VPCRVISLAGTPQDMQTLEELLAEAQRQVTVCNACRYCEGYCAAFPAMELREHLAAGDLGYIANLCHDCRACYQACPYTFPHEFEINIPSLLAAARVATYSHYVQPSRASRVFSSGKFLLLVAVALFVVTVGAIVGLGLSHHLSAPAGHQGDFYSVVSYTAMMVPALVLSVYALITVAVGCVRFFRDVGGAARPATRSDWLRLAGDLVLLRWMRGGGGGCHYPDPDEPSTQRRWLHQAMAGGFVSAFLATIAAAVEQDMMGIFPPYPLLSVPVMLGLLGGVALIVGTAGLLILKRRDALALANADSRLLDYSLLWSLAAISVTGIGLLVLRNSPVMGPLLIAHLGLVAFFLVTVPYGKFVHAAYRTVALLIWHGERRGSSFGHVE